MSVKALAEKYNKFQHDFGQSVAQDYEGTIQALFTPQFRKIANGAELAGDRAQLLPQLTGVKDFAGKWSIDCQELIPSSDDAKCTIRYFLKSEKAGQFEVIAILKAQDGLINQIDEVFYQQIH